MRVKEWLSSQALMLIFWLVAFLSVASIPVSLLLPLVFPNDFASYSLLFVLMMYYLFRHCYRGASYWPWFHSVLIDWHRSHRYFDEEKLVFDANVNTLTDDLKKGRVMLAHSPHGITCNGWAVNEILNTFFFPFNIHWLAVGEVFLIPFISDFLIWIGADSAEKAKLVQFMDKGDNIAIIPGGFEEATVFAYGHHRLWLKHRFGFIKYAMMYGYRIYPTYTFGEESTFHSLTGLLEWRLALNRWKIPGVVWIGRGFLPYNQIKLITVIGEALILPHVEKPSEDLVEEWHQIYIQRVIHLFNKYKQVCLQAPDAATAQLEIF